MEITTFLTWAAALAVGGLALAALVHTLEAVLDLDIG
jgi:hypothetical protein